MDDPPESASNKNWRCKLPIYAVLLLLGVVVAVSIGVAFVVASYGRNHQSTINEDHHEYKYEHEHDSIGGNDRVNHEDILANSFLRRRGVSLEPPQILPNGLNTTVYLQPETETEVSEETCDEACCQQYLYCPSQNEWINAVPFEAQIVLIIILIFLSALFSGLTLGLMSLDMTGLEIVMDGDDDESAKAARIIYPVRSNGNLLLVTLLLGNVAVNAMLSILLADKAGGIVGFFTSTMLIVIFGEIIPQAACNRYALQVGSRTVPIVRVIMILFYPLSWPIARILDKVLGHELATTYSTAEMRKLLEIHVKEGRFDQETAEAMTGALKYKSICVKEVMTPLEHTFMLSVDEKLNFETIATIFKSGYSRIPVFEVSVNNVIGLLFVKDLIFIDPEDETPVRSFVQIFGRGVHVVWPDDKLGDVLRELKQGRSHMALVRDVNNQDTDQDPFYEIKGIVTLEDIIEEILGDEIVDETDAFVDRTHEVKVNRMENFDWGRLRLLDNKIVDETLSFDESRAVIAHLRANYASAFRLVTDNQLHRLVAETSVTELLSAEREVGLDLPKQLLYEKGLTTNTCTLILSGKVTVLVGHDNFRTDLSSWSVLALAALTELDHKPDFSAFVSHGPCRCLRFQKDRFQAAVDASAFERRAHHARGGSNIPSDSGSDQNIFESFSSFATMGSSLANIEVEALSPSPQPLEYDRSSFKKLHNQNRRKRLMEAFQKHSTSKRELEKALASTSPLGEAGDEEDGIRISKKEEEDRGAQLSKKKEEDGIRSTKKEEEEEEDGIRLTKKKEEDGIRLTKKKEEDGIRFAKKKEEDGIRLTKEEDGIRIAKKKDEDSIRLAKREDEEEDSKAERRRRRRRPSAVGYGSTLIEEGVADNTGAVNTILSNADKTFFFSQPWSSSGTTSTATTAKTKIETTTTTGVVPENGSSKATTNRKGHGNGGGMDGMGQSHHHHNNVLNTIPPSPPPRPRINPSSGDSKIEFIAGYMGCTS